MSAIYGFEDNMKKGEVINKNSIVNITSPISALTTLNLDYPNGLTQQNSILIGKLVDNRDNVVNVSVWLTATSIRITNTDNASYTVKLSLMRTDI